MILGAIGERELMVAPRTRGLYVARAVAAALPLGIIATCWLVVAGSQAVIALSLVNGATTWPTLSVNSAPFALVTGTSTTFVLRQAFVLDGVQLAGPGGSWVVDVPITSSLAPVPEPAAAWLLAAGLAGLAGLDRRRGLRPVAHRAGC